MKFTTIYYSLLNEQWLSHYVDFSACKLALADLKDALSTTSSEEDGGPDQATAEAARLGTFERAYGALPPLEQSFFATLIDGMQRSDRFFAELEADTLRVYRDLRQRVEEVSFELDSELQNEVLQFSVTVEHVADFIPLNRHAAGVLARRFDKLTGTDIGVMFLEQFVGRLKSYASRFVHNFRPMYEQLLNPPSGEELGLDFAGLANEVFTFFRRNIALTPFPEGDAGGAADAVVVDQLDVSQYALGKTTRVWVNVLEGSFGESLAVPVFVNRGEKPGATVGYVGAIEHNDIACVRVLQQFQSVMDMRITHGTVVVVLCSNVHGLGASHRSRTFARRLVQRVFADCFAVVELKPASESRFDTLTASADLSDPVTLRLARLLSPNVLVDVRPGALPWEPPSVEGIDDNETDPFMDRDVEESVLRAAQRQRIRAVQLLVGSAHGPLSLASKEPHEQRSLHHHVLRGALACLSFLHVVALGRTHDDDWQALVSLSAVGHSPSWIPAVRGGIVYFEASLNTWLRPGEKMATQRDGFLEPLGSQHSPFLDVDVFVIACSKNIVLQPGDRTLLVLFPSAPAVLERRQPQPPPPQQAAQYRSNGLAPERYEDRGDDSDEASYSYSAYSYSDEDDFGADDDELALRIQEQQEQLRREQEERRRLKAEEEAAAAAAAAARSQKLSRKPRACRTARHHSRQ